MEHLDDEDLLPVRTPTLILSRTRFVASFNFFNLTIIITNDSFIFLFVKLIHCRY